MRLARPLRPLLLPAALLAAAALPAAAQGTAKAKPQPAAASKPKAAAPAATPAPAPAAKGGAMDPSACLQSIDERTYKVYQDSSAAGHPLDDAGLDRVRAGIARECTAGVAIVGQAPQGLVMLTMLFKVAGDSLRADSAAQQLLTVAGANRAAALYFLTVAYLMGPVAEHYAAALDSLPPAAAPFKFQAHAGLLTRYRHEDVDERVLQHARATIALGQELGPYADDSSAIASLVDAHKALAEVYGDYGQVDSSLAVLDRGIAAYGAKTHDTTATLRTLRARYAMVGTQAPALTSKLWLNSADSTKAPVLTGKVTVLQFTATWCPPCRRSYPTMVALSKQFDPAAVQVVMTTDLYGTFLGKKVDATAELAGDRDYYLKKNGMTFPIGIYRLDLRKEGEAFQNDNDDRWHLTDIPMVAIIDRKGTIRRLLVGWDAGNPDRITAVVKELLKG